MSKDKLEAFDHGTLNPPKKHLSKKELEEMKKKVEKYLNRLKFCLSKKKIILKQDNLATAEVLEDFVASFDSNGKPIVKMFVKGATINPANNGLFISNN